MQITGNSMRGALTWLLAAMLAALPMLGLPGSALAASPNKANTSSATTKLTIVQAPASDGWNFDGSGAGTRYRWLGSEGGNLVYCINPGISNGPFDGTKATLPARLLAKSDFKSEALYEACLAALYYAPGGPGYETDEGTTGGLIGRKLFPDEDYKGGSFGKKDRFACAHCLMGFYYNDASWAKSYPESNHQPASSYVSWFEKNMLPAKWGGTGSSSYGQQAINHFNDKDMLDNGGYTVQAWKDSVYLVMSGSDTSKQDVLTYVDAPRGPIKLAKASSDISITKDNGCYSLQGAQYGVYSDKAATHSIGTLTTGADGKAELKDVVAGTYYIKETKPSKGYRLDTAIYTVKVVKDSGASLSVKEEPLVSPIDLLVSKDGMGEAEGVPQGEASLADAEFTICYYDGQYDAASIPAAPTRTWTVRTDETGKVRAADMASLKVEGPDLYSHDGQAVFPLGTVTLQETKAPRGYQLADAQGKEPALQVVNITEDTAGHTVAHAYNAPVQQDAPRMLGLRIVKEDGPLAGAQPEGDADLARAEFSVVNESSHSVLVGGAYYQPGEECLVVETQQKDGAYIAEALEALPFGNYTVREKTPPTGYLPNSTWEQKIEVDADTPHGQVFDFSEQPCIDEPKRGGIRVPKIDRELQENLPLGAATLAGAEISLRLESPNPVKVDGAVFSTGEVVKTIVTDEKGVAETGSHDLPYGTYSVFESKAPEGYLLNDQWRQTVEVREDGAIYETAHLDDQVKRGDVRFNKVNGDTMAHLGAVAFLITSKTTGETHVAVTDENGNLDTSATWAAHTRETNANDAAAGVGAPGGDAAAEDEPGVEGEGEGPQGDDPDGTPSDEDGETPDSAGDAGDGDSGGDDGSGAEDENPAEAGNDGDGGGGASEGEPGAAMSASALADALAKALGADSARITDASALMERIAAAGADEDVAFDATLVAEGSESAVQLIATLQEDGSLVVRDAQTDEEVLALEPGEAQLSEMAAGSESPQGSESPEDAAAGNETDAGGDDSPSDSADAGAVDDAALDPEAGIWFNGRTDRTTASDDALGALPYDTYTFQELRGARNAGMRLVHFEVRVYRDAADIDLGTVDDQPIGVLTQLKGVADSHLAPAQDSVELVDAVACSNLEVGKDYRLRGWLVDKSSADAVGEASEVSFTAKRANQTVDVPFTVDTSELAGKSLVAYQELYEGETLVAEHKEIDDADETVYVPHIGTTLEDETGSKTATSSGTVTLVDRVDYGNLVAGLEYSLHATLHIKAADGGDAGALLDADGKPVEGSITFIPAASSGSQAVELSFDASALGDAEAVAFEELMFEGSVIARHDDIADPAQTMTFKAPEPEGTGDGPDVDSPANGPSPAGKGTPFDRTGYLLERYWPFAALAVLTGIGAGWYALSRRRSPYGSWREITNLASGAGRPGTARNGWDWPWREER